MQRSTPDVLVVGTGPSGLIAAQACAALGLRTVCVGPEPDGAWRNLYGIWLDQLADADLVAAMSATWGSVTVRHEYTKTVQRAYGRVDNERWQAILRGRSGVALDRFVAVAAQEDPQGVTVFDGRGRTLRARVVIDASGASSGLLRRTGAPSLFQVAWGQLVQADGLGIRARWMDFGEAAGPSSFLYALPMPDGRWFVEETALVCRPARPLPALQRRLDERLAGEGVRVRRVDAVERCVIPMDVPVPPAQRVVGFGAAAGMVHPASGYLLPRVLDDAPVLAKAITAGLAWDPPTASARAWEALWPASRRRARDLYAWGAAVLAGLDAAETRAFFAAFFELPEATWREFLGDRLPPARIAAVMASTFARLPLRLGMRVVHRGATALLQESP